MPSRTYKKAPVTEAVIEFRFATPIPKADLERIARRLSGSFPKIEEEKTYDLRLSTGGLDVNQASSGFKLTAADDLKITLVRNSGITNSRLAPYGGWELLREQAEDVLANVRKVIDRRPMQRIGLRYVNRLDIPGIDVSLQDWVNFTVALPFGLGPTLEELNVRVVVPLETGMKCALAIQTVPSPLMDHSSIILDLDLSVEQDIPLADEPMWELLEGMRNKKNEIFEASITEPMRSQFGGLEGS
ncbi:MAG: TIGR04255 family protein [Fimbriimonadaceae bacterium]|nr:TIGR04255 family protein [Alphaproteobacteria bacterium]